MIHRRDFIKSSLGFSALLGTNHLFNSHITEAAPISIEERKGRISKAQELLKKNKRKRFIKPQNFYIC